MSTLEHIYVNINESYDNTPDRNSNDYDDNFQNLIVKCDTDTGVGNKDNPLTFNEFRNYIRYPKGINQTFHLYGERVCTDDNIDDGIVFNYKIFEILFNDDVEIVITNWNDFESEYNTPWKIKYNITTGLDRYYLYSNTNLKLLNGEIELENKDIVFACSSNIQSKNIEINNFKLFGDNEDYVILFVRYNDVKIINSLFHNRERDNLTIDGRIAFDCLDIVDSTQTNITIVNTIFSGINGFIARGSYQENINYCVFNRYEVIESLINEYENLTVDQSTNSFEFLIPENIIDQPISATDLEDYNYLTSSWYGDDNITISGDDYYYEYTFGELNNTQRDGIGPLTYTMMSDFNVSASVVPSNINSPVTFSIVDDTYDNTYKPSQYIIEYNDVEITSSTSDIDVVFDSVDVFDVDYIVKSHNNWYEKKSTFTHISQLDVIGEIQIELFRTKEYKDEKTHTESIDTSASTLDLITISVTNITSADSDIKVFESINIDFSDKNTTNMDYTNTLIVEEFSLPGGNITDENRYLIPGTYDIFVSAIMVDGRIVTEKKTITIYEHDKKEYYVDLLLDGEVNANSFIYDDFNDGIDDDWNDTFKTNYSVVDMFGELVAIDSDSNNTILMSNISRHDFTAEFSFYRNDRFDIPEFTIYRSTGFPNNLIRIEWDYTRDAIILHYRIGTTGSYKNKEIKYNIPPDYVRDLRCSNSLRELHFKIKNENDKFIIQYTFNPDFDWETIVGEDDDWFMVSQKMIINVKSSNTVGFNYIKLESSNGLPNYYGTPENPFPYLTFYNRITSDNVDSEDIDVNIGGYNDIYRCKNYRIIDEIKVNSDKFFEINSWYDSKNPEQYRNIGPWMLVISNMSRNFILDDFVSSTRFVGTRLSNGILYNYNEPEQNKNSTNNLHLSFLYNMFIIWQGIKGHIRFTTSRWLGREHKYREIVGSTIKTNNKIVGI
ncbi:MAG: hypothetical protein ACOCZ5_00255 [bacterium]